MKPILVIGNGESRKHVDLDKLDMFKIGCNAIYRDFDVDILVCADLRMVKEALDKNVDQTIYTRKDWAERFSEKNIQSFPQLPYQGSKRWDEEWNWGSGPYAVLLASMQNNNSTIHMLGFDLYANDNKLNNIYKDTVNYNKSEDHPVDPTYWIYQIGKVISCFKDCNFIIHNLTSWNIPKNWQLPNVKLDTIDNLVYKYTSGLPTLTPL
jgi:hypothetical protein